jgi:Spx/MgsR family transcriptional regulator
MIIMYGIPNCDTIKKAKKWFEAENIPFSFHDYKKAGVDRDVIERAIKTNQIDVVVNQRGTTYRKLSNEDKATINQGTDLNNILDLLCQNPSLIKRPIVYIQSAEKDNSFIIGFDESKYRELKNGA